MAALGSQTIAASYEQLLHVDTDGGGDTTTLVPIKDGDNGTTFCLQLATTSALIVDDAKLYFGTGSDASFEYDEDGNDVLLYDGANFRINDDTQLQFGAAADWTVEYDEDGNDDLVFTGSDMAIESSTTAKPLVLIKNTTDDQVGAELRFVATQGGTNGVDNDVAGTISFYSNDDGTPTNQKFAQMVCKATDVTSGGEEGSLSFGVAEYDGTVTDGLVLTGQPADGEIDVTIGAGAASTTTVAGGLTISGTSALAIAGDLDMEDDKGIIFGSDDDYWVGLAAGEGYIVLHRGGTLGEGTNEGQVQLEVGDSGSTYMLLKGGEAGRAILYMNADQGDNDSDRWSIQVPDTSTTGYMYFNSANNTTDQCLRFHEGGYGSADATWDDNTWDYAELFEWKTHLDSDDAIKDLFGMSVVLDGDAVRIAEEGEENKILGVVRPKGVTASHGDGLKWRGKYIQNVWGEYEEEGYTQVNWQEFLPNGNISYRHAYHKDEIPEYKLKMGIGRDLDNWKKEENFELNKDGEKIPVVVPSTEEEKTAANYVERNHKKNQSDIPLMRRKYSDTYDPSIPYIRREDRPKEWVLIGLLGQVPVRTSAVIPDHWVKQKNLESGIDFYYIFNK